MKQFISAQDAPNINALVSKALDYKANPFKDKTLGVNRCTKSRHGMHCV